MSMLDKHLARYAQECVQLDADGWMLALTNGASLTVSARRDEDFLLLDADTGVRARPERLAWLVEQSNKLPAAVKFAVPGGWSAIRLRAEFPLPEDSGAVGDRIGGNIAAMRGAMHLLDEWVSCEAAGEGTACPEPNGSGQAVAGSLMESLQEAGWAYHERPGAALLADLETGSQFCQAEIGQCAAGARFRVTLFHDVSPGDAVRQAISQYLLEANAALRCSRAFLQRVGNGLDAGFEVYVEGEPAAADIGHALAALSVAARECARELEVLKDGAVAGVYRSARPLLHCQ